MRICVIYDCLFPWTIGGAERWYRRLAEGLAADGHEVTYLTMRQWERTDEPDIQGVRVVAVSPRMALYVSGRRRILPPVMFGLGIFWHMLRHGRRYDYIHTASFPFFSLIAVGILKPIFSFRIAVDWIEVWTKTYWESYLGRLGKLGWVTQKLCAYIPQSAYSFSQLHAQRARELLGLKNVIPLTGFFPGSGRHPLMEASNPPVVVYAGRLIAEKRVSLLVEALAICMAGERELKAVIFGSGPEFASIKAQITGLGLNQRIDLPGFVDQELMDRTIATASVLVQPSEREGYGIVVAEASACGIPVVVIDGEDNAATELVDDGQNGYKAPDASADTLASAITRCLARSSTLRQSTRNWYGKNAERLSMESSVAHVRASLHSMIRN